MTLTDPEGNEFDLIAAAYHRNPAHRPSWLMSLRDVSSAACTFPGVVVTVACCRMRGRACPVIVRA